jgi:1,4-dihydroxy-2-naphthoyl-CoA hydrolase
MSIWKQNIDLVALNNNRADGLGKLLDISIVARNKNSLFAEMPVSEKHKQPHGIVHGGATASLAETVASIAAWLCVDTKNYITVGLELNINHLRAVRKGVLRAISTAVHVGRSTQVWQIDIYNDENKQVSSSRLTVSNISKK